MTSRLNGSNRVYVAPSEEKTISAPTARKQLNEGLQEKARLERLNETKANIVNLSQNIENIDKTRVKIASGNDVRANRQAALAAKRALNK